jgi:DNA-binding response OmpR family regulator
MSSRKVLGDAHRAFRGVFPKSGLPVIILTDLGLESRKMTGYVLAHELLIKPISPKALQQCLLGIVLNPRPMARAGRFYIPMPRRGVEFPRTDSSSLEIPKRRRPVTDVTETGARRFYD